MKEYMPMHRGNSIIIIWKTINKLSGGGEGKDRKPVSNHFQQYIRVR